MPKDLSYETKRGLIMNAIDPNNEYRVWIKDLFADKVVIEDAGKLYEMTYSINEGKATLGERKEVVAAYEALAEMKDVEVLKTGTFTDMNGKKVTFTDADLDEIVKNSEELKNSLKPPLVATHDEGSNASVSVFGSLTGGTFHNLRRAGSKILADITGVPKKAVDLLKEVGEFRLSPEVYNNYEEDGRSFGKALRRVAWVDIPAIKTMAGITEANLFEEQPDQPTAWILFSEQAQSKEKKEKKQMDLSKLKEESPELYSKFTEMQEENKALKTANESALTKLSEKETAEKKGKVSAMVKPFRDAGLAPVVADRLEKFAEGLDGSKVMKFGEKEHTQLDELNSLLDSMFKKEKDGKLIVQFGEKAPGHDSFGEDAERKQVAANIASGAKGA